MALWNPKAFPLSFPLQDWERRASRGELLIPFPIRSEKRRKRTWRADVASPIKGRVTDARAYPKKINLFLFWNRSETQPEKSFKKLDTLSAMPSMRPTKITPAPNT
jgi:hypothetical protein